MVSGQIYRMTTDSGKCYVGLTTIPISFRIANYKCEYGKYKEGLPCKKNAMFELMDEGDLKLEILEDVEADSLKELRRRQGWWVRNSDNCINKTIPGRTDKEYYEDNRETHRARDKIKYQLNRDKLLAASKAYQARKRAEAKNGLIDVTQIVTNIIPLAPEEKMRQSKIIENFFNNYMPAKN